MTLAFSLPPQTDSPLGRLDPRWRLAGIILLALAMSLQRSLPGATLALLVAVFLAILVRLPLSWLFERLGAVALVLAFFSLPLTFLMGGDGPAVDWGPIRLSWTGARAA